MGTAIGVADTPCGAFAYAALPHTARDVRTARLYHGHGYAYVIRRIPQIL